MGAVGLLQAGSALVLNAGFCWLAGSLPARLWLARADAQDGRRDAVLRRCEAGAALACVLGIAASLWAAAAVMGGSGLREAADLLPMVATGTAYGRAGLLGAGAIALCGALAALGRGRRAALAAGGALLAVFVLCRAAVSHAGEQGPFSFGFAVEALHLALVGVWSGGVALAAWVVMPAARQAPLAYMASLSRAATIALGGIVASGMYNAFQRIDTLDRLATDPYGQALTVKLALFGAAAGLGAYNRFAGFPAAARGDGKRALLVLRLESLALLGALAAAAVLVSQAPPA